MSKRLVLPFASLHVNRKQSFSPQMETAAVVCLAEAKRKKKIGLLGGEPERIAAVSKLYYPLWLVPWENEYVTVGGMKLHSFEANYGKLPDYNSFITDIEKAQESYEEFMKILQQNLKTFKEFASVDRIIIEGVVQDKELQTSLFDYFKKEAPSEETQMNEAAFLEPRLGEKEAMGKVGEVVDLWEQNQSDIQAMEKTITALDEATEAMSTKLSEHIEEVTREYEAKIQELRPAVDDRVRQLAHDRDEKARIITESGDKELEVRMKEKAEFEKKLTVLQQEKTEFVEKKELAKIRKDDMRVKRWKFSINERDKRISELSKRMKKLEQHIDQTMKDKEKSLKQTNETYQAQIDEENAKIPSLESERDAKTLEVQDNIDQLRSTVNGITKQIQALIEEKHDFATDLKAVATAWKLEATILLCVPFYLIDYSSETKHRQVFHAPVLIPSPEGLLKTIKKKLGFSFESRMSALLHDRSTPLARMLSSIVAQQTEKDIELKDQLRTKAEQNNALHSLDFQHNLTESLEKLQAEEWLKPEEKNMVLQAFAK